VEAALFCNLETCQSSIYLLLFLNRDIGPLPIFDWKLIPMTAGRVFLIANYSEMFKGLDMRANSHRGQSIGEEIANSISHGAGLIGALVGAPFLVMHAVRHGDAGLI
jgi:hypothetical protein